VPSLEDGETETRGVTFEEAGITRAEFGQMYEMEEAAAIAGTKTELLPDGPYERRTEAAVSKAFQSVEDGMAMMFPSHRMQEAIAMDYAYLNGRGAAPPARVAGSSFPLQVIIAGGIGLVMGLGWMSYSDRTRERVHHKANSWRYESEQ
jgi:hypothetical protein